jgi:hypothetical protein
VERFLIKGILSRRRDSFWGAEYGCEMAMVISTRP